MPLTRCEFWQKKIDKNRINDNRSIAALRSDNWRVATVWECALKGSSRHDESTVVDSLSQWLLGNKSSLEISANAKGNG